MNKNSIARQMALGGIFAALAVVVMCLGGLIPIATYVSPMLSAIMLQVVLNACGKRIAWAWYGAVCILGLLLSADKESAATFVFLGYYPIIKPFFDSKLAKVLWKLAFFNGAILAMYTLLLGILGVPSLKSEFRELGAALTVVLLIIGNITLFLFDKVLGKPFFRKLGKYGN